MISGRVADKVALVTGAASGIGAAVARTLAREGAYVALADIDTSGLETTLLEITSAGGAGYAISLDTTVESDWVAAVETLLSKYGRLNIAVNCAGVGLARTDPSETSLEEWRRHLTVNLDAVFLGTKYALRAMKCSEPMNGSIINISSIMGITALADVAAYNAGKGGVRLYTKSVALSCAERQWNIRADSIHPGFIDTPLLRKAMERFGDPEAAQCHYNGLQPIGRLGTPDDVAYGALYLASDESHFVTGSELVIDGGYTAR